FSPKWDNSIIITFNSESPATAKDFAETPSVRNKVQSLACIPPPELQLQQSQHAYPEEFINERGIEDFAYQISDVYSIKDLDHIFDPIQRYNGEVVETPSKNITNKFIQMGRIVSFKTLLREIQAEEEQRKQKQGNVKLASITQQTC
ncbi:10638_t:CDS:2, partial [Funneliformis geosporum]